MKRILALVLACLLILPIISACSNNVETTAKESETVSTTQTETEKIETTQAPVTETETEATTQTEEETTEAVTTAEETTEAEEPLVVPDDSLLAWYTFDEIVDGYIADKSGNGFDAQVKGKAKIVSVDENTNAVSFENGGDSLYIQDNKAFNVKPDEDFTLIVTLKWSGKIFDTWPCIFNKGLLTVSGKEKYYGFWLDTTGKPSLGLTSVYGNGTSNTLAKFSLDTEWHTFVAVQDGANKTIYFFIDDECVGSRQSVTCVTEIGVYIGINGNTASQGQFLGQISEVALYKSTYGLKLGEAGGVDSLARKTYEYTSPTTAKSMNLPYRIYFPSDYGTTDKKYPLFLYLHGYGEIGDNNTSQLRITNAQEENKILSEIVDRDNCIVIAPQCKDPADYNWVGLNHWWFTGAREKLSENPTIALEAATALLKETIANEKVDESRIYVCGISMGGYGTWEILARNPELFAAAIPICGGGILSSAESLKDVAIWAFHGEADSTVPVSGTKDMISALVAAGSKKAKATYFPGVGHSCWNNVFAVDGVVDWLYEQHR